MFTAEQRKDRGYFMLDYDGFAIFKDHKWTLIDGDTKEDAFILIDMMILFEKEMERSNILENL